MGSLMDGFELTPRTKTRSKSGRTFDQIVDAAIDDQVKIAKGEMVPGNKAKDGTQLYKKSWYNESSKAVVPKVWIKEVFPDKEIKMSKEQYDGWIKIVKGEWREDSIWAPAIDKIRDAYNKQYKLGEYAG